MKLEEIIELVSAAVHKSWMETKILNGVSSRKFAETGEELMVPYDKLSEKAKDADRITVKTTIEALDKLGFEIKKK
jgi:RyR domain-containing protein